MKKKKQSRRQVELLEQPRCPHPVRWSYSALAGLAAAHPGWTGQPQNHAPSTASPGTVPDPVCSRPGCTPK